MDLGTSSSLPVTIRVPGYRLRRQIGEDAIGIWLDAEQESLGRHVTVKVLKPEYERHEGARREFLAEMDRLAALSHGNLLRVLDTVRGDSLVLVTEGAAGRTLADVMAPGKPLGEAASFGYARDIARALSYLDGKGFAHKNLTPSLVLALDENHARLITFRYVIRIEDQRALKGKLAQDANYVAPEQLGGEDEIGDRTPCYQIGALVFHMLAGRPPHGPGKPADVARAHFREEFPSLKRFQPFLAAHVYEVLDACTRRTPSERPTLAELEQALAAMADGRPPNLSSSGAPKPLVVRRRKRRRRY